LAEDILSVVSETIARAAEAAEAFVNDGLEPMMNRFNRSEK